MQIKLRVNEHKDSFLAAVNSNMEEEITNEDNISVRRRRKDVRNSEPESMPGPPPPKRRSGCEYDIFTMFTTVNESDPVEQGDSNRNINSIIDDEVNNYINEGIANVSGVSCYDFDILNWWKIHQTKYPLLAQLAKFIHSIPATSAPSERLFSAAGNTVTEKRSRISPEVLHSVLLLKSNYDLLQPSINS